MTFVAHFWRPALAVGVLGFLGLVPGIVVVAWMTGGSDSALVLVAGTAAFGGLLLAPLAARAADRIGQVADGDPP